MPVNQQPEIIQACIRNVRFGLNAKIIQPVNLYECDIGDDCFIGPFVEIQRGVTIGSKTKIQSHTFICELVTIGGHCFIGHGVMFINDTFVSGGPAGGDRQLWRPTLIGDRVSIGSSATLLPVSVCSDVIIGAGSVVTKNIEQSGIYAGNPARRIK
jgi:acetyltransferase-like isoleucine patch superfamily enzyme